MSSYRDPGTLKEKMVQMLIVVFRRIHVVF